MIATLALLAFVAGPGDTPIEEINSDIVTLVLASDSSTELCTALGELDGAIVAMLDVVEVVEGDSASRPAVEGWLTETITAWAVDQLEDGVGPAAAFTPEAEALVEDWAETCQVGV